MTLKKHFFKTSRTARVYVLSPEKDSEIKDVWLCAHGYGYLGVDFCAMLEPLQAPHRLIVVPEALSRYYLKGTGGKTGANWMTSDDREIDIQDIHDYLNALLASDIVPKGAKLHLFGFSQGVTTLLRWWLSHAEVKPHSVTTWAGGFPHEYAIKMIAEYKNSVPMSIVYGLQDPYLNDHYIQQAELLKSSRGENCSITTFEGKHELEAATLIALALKNEL